MLYVINKSWHKGSRAIYCPTYILGNINIALHVTAYRGFSGSARHFDPPTQQALNAYMQYLSKKWCIFSSVTCCLNGIVIDVNFHTIIECFVHFRCVAEHSAFL